MRVTTHKPGTGGKAVTAVVDTAVMAGGIAAVIDASGATVDINATGDAMAADAAEGL